jgi:UDP-N-acetylmuramoyl-L-alanyl-D-glutamate--2,6-diaminopimelate ligase
MHSRSSARDPLLSGYAGLTADSRRVQSGWLFAALRGVKADGRDYIDQALDAGAATILTDAVSDEVAARIRDRAELLMSDNPRLCLAQLAAQHYGRQPSRIALVTGTNGKTSTVEFTRQLWALLGTKAASLGTLGLSLPDGRHEGSVGSMTTPDPVGLAEMLAHLAEDGIEHVAIEASSHGLDQERLSGVKASVGVFTSFSRDHLDYHQTPEAYLDAKLRLFRERLPEGAPAVVCADLSVSEAVLAAAREHGLDLWDYGEQAERLALLSHKPIPGGQRLVMRLDGQSFTVDLPLVGDFQALNAMAALGIVLSLGADRTQAVEALTQLRGVDGRLQLAGSTVEGATVYVDYAHTPDALEAALSALRPSTAGDLWVVFGAGGDRDQGKRPEMGGAALAKADRIVVTDDNPRSEDPAIIRQMIMAVCPQAEEIGDRAQAIASAVARLGPGDVLLIAGKGHEAGQTIGTTVLPFDDLQQAQAALEARS